MSRKRLNLFNRQERRSIAAILTEKTTLYSTILGVVLFVVFLFLSTTSVFQKTQIQSLKNEKQQLLNFLVENKNSEAETAYFLLKKEQLKTFMKDDAQFLPYYDILRTSLLIASNDATIESMFIDKNKKTQFVINFSEYDSMYRFIKHIESEEFLKYFDTLVLTSFVLNQSNQRLRRGYQLNFEGKFRPLEEKS
jgi:hypothetical protein